MRRFALTLLFLAVTPIVAIAEEDAKSGGNLLSVRGTGTYEKKPDVARFTATVTTKGPTLESAGEEHKGRTAQALPMVKALEGAGLNIEKSTFSLRKDAQPYPMASNPNPQPGENPFTAQTSLSLRVTQVDSLNDLIDKLQATKLIEISGVTFSVVADRAALNEARRAAVLDAREQARVYAEAADLKLVEITSMTDGDATPPDGFADLQRAAYTVIIPPALVQFTSAVTIRWRISGKNN